MKIYRDTKGIYWIDDTTVPSGEYRLKVSGDKSKVTITPFDMDYMDRLPSYYDLVITNLVKEDDTNYSNFTEFYNELSGLFKKEFDGLSDSTASLSVNLKDDNQRTALNTVFGDSIIGTRVPAMSLQFQYGVDTNATNAVTNGTGSVSIVDAMLNISTGVGADGSAMIETLDTLRYIPGHETYCLFTATFTTGAVNSVQRAGLFDASNGFMVGYEDDEFCFTRLDDGVYYKSVIDLTEFNEKAQAFHPGYTFDPTKGNIYRITFGYLGFAPISLEVMLPNSSYLTMAKIEYPNSSNETHIKQTFLPLRGEVINSGNTTDMVLKAGSVSAGIVDGGGASDVNGRSFSWANAATYTFSNNATIVSFRIKDTFNSIPNKVASKLLLVSGANASNKTLKWRILRNPTLTNPGTATWNDIDATNSVMEYSEDADVNIGVSSDLVLAWNTGTSADFFNDVSQYTIQMRPGEIASVVILSTATNAEADLSIRWRELF